MNDFTKGLIWRPILHHSDFFLKILKIKNKNFEKLIYLQNKIHQNTFAKIDLL
jgi:hypothetical protein